MKYFLCKFQNVPIIKSFRYNKKWYFLAGTGSIFQYVGDQVTIFSGINIEKDEVVGIGVKE